MKTGRKTWIVIAVILIGIGVAVSLAVWILTGGDFEKIASATITEQTFRAEKPFDSIAVDVSSADVRLTVSDTNESYVVCRKAKREGFDCAVAVEDGTLSVSLVDHRKWYQYIGFFDCGTEITVCLNESVYEKLRVITSSGSIEIPDGFTFAQADIRLSSGDICFGARVQNALKAETSNGEIEISGVKAETVILESSSGSISTDDVTCDDFSVKASSGSVTLKDVIAKNINCDTKSGDVELDACDADAMQFSAVSGSVEGTLRSDKIFIVNTKSGKQNVPKTTAGGICEISTASGDVDITIEKRD